MGASTAIGALDVDTTGALTLNDAVTAGSIALDGAADVDLATGAITLDTSAANGEVTLQPQVMLTRPEFNDQCWKRNGQLECSGSRNGDGLM